MSAYQKKELKKYWEEMKMINVEGFLNVINCDRPTCNGCYWYDADTGTCAKTKSSLQIEEEY